MSKYYPTKNPCKGCTRRTVGCHTNCEDYKEWVNNGVEVPPKVTYYKTGNNAAVIRRKEETKQ